MDYYEQMIGDLQDRCKELGGEVAELEKDKARIEDCLQKIKNWCDAYPLKVFPEPDFEAVRDALRFYGLSLDAVSASNMRHVVNGVKEEIDKAMQPQQSVEEG